MGTFDVTLSNTQTVVFPPLCVVCEKQNPDSVIKLSFLGIKTTPLLTMATDKMLYGDVDPKCYDSNTSNKIEGIPAYKGCVRGLKWYHRFLKFGYYTGWLPGVGLIFLGLPTWRSVTVCVVGACLPGVLTFIFPPAFGASFWDNKANFEFKSNTVAAKFLKLNSDAALKNEDKTAPSALINETQKNE